MSCFAPMITLLPPLIRRLIFAATAFIPLLATSAAFAADVYIWPETRNPVLPGQYAPGTSVTFRVNDSIASSAHQWLHDDLPIPGATAHTLVLANLSAVDTGNYRLRVVTDGSVALSNTETINVLPLPPSPVDTSFSAELPAGTYSARALIFAEDQSMVVEATVQGDSSNPQLMRLRTNGSRDDRFEPPAGTRVLAGLPDGGLIVAAPPYRLDRNGGPNALSLPASFDSTKNLSAAAVQPDGKLLIAQNDRIARLEADGAIDPTFTYTVDSASPIAIDSLLLDRSGRIYARGSRLNPVPTNSPSSWQIVIRLAASGQHDASFVSPEPVLLRGSLQVTPLADGRILHVSRYHGYRVWQILRDDGKPDPTWSAAPPFSDADPVIDPTRSLAYVVESGGVIRRYRIGTTGPTADDTFYPGTGEARAGAVVLDPAGQLLVGGRVGELEGNPSTSLTRLLTTIPSGAQPPNVRIAQDIHVPERGGTITFSSFVTGTGPFTYEWRGLDRQPLPVDATSPTLVLTAITGVNFGRYQLRVTGPGGAVLSNVVELTLASSQPPYLANISGRAMAGVDENTMIAGVTVRTDAGSPGLATLLRGVGPGLQPLGVIGFMADPALDILAARGQSLAHNDRWSTVPGLAAVAASAGAFSLAENSDDAALLQPLVTGTYTLHLHPQSGSTGVALIEVYRVPEEQDSGELLNLSFRARTTPGDDTAIAGFVVRDPAEFGRPLRVLLRAVGPTLATQGITTPIPNPILTVYDRSGEVVATNDDWALNNTSGDQTTLTAAMQQTGAFALPATSKDAALLLDLPPGAYSMHATGGTGVVLLEIYIVR